jgi:putative heme-binding domain-containing protein
MQNTRSPDRKMCCRRSCIGLLCIMALTLAAPAAGPPEKWADAALPVLDGLELWLDARRQGDVRRALGRPPVKDGQELADFYDASGHGRHLTQKDARSRPTFVDIDGYQAVRFDGRSQYLAHDRRHSDSRAMTVFLVGTAFTNPGGFRGYLALNQKGKNDYVSGLNVDMGWAGHGRFQFLNLEGAGFPGERNLLRDAANFGMLQTITVVAAPGKGGVKLFVNGKQQRNRDRTESMVSWDRITLGARYYTNGGPPETRGFLDGDVSEVLIYSRALNDADRHAVEKYLLARHGRNRKVPWPRPGKQLVAVEKAPPVQVFVPGFTVRQLPVNLSNINNVKYRRDGKLVALAYDGNIYLLSDSDNDGLEDRVELFWENRGRLRSPIGMDLTPPGYSLGEGVLIACKGKCTLILDTDGDNRADKEVVAAEGWHELPHGVDALGAAFDPKDGSIYFGLGTRDFTNPYLIAKDGTAHYNLKSERGTILHVTPDLKHREIIATGIRFPVGIRFHPNGDVFCTDQEGATWLVNGNPFDELLHIQKGRHYGFPPRHPRHLPAVIDEPSVFDYGPQHQSTCGLNFNEPVNGGPVFGPAAWRGDVFVAGYSRGKLYRTQLVKTVGGYVAQNHLFAALDMLTCDACISPQGDLLVCVHAGGPDWGNGPSGKGKLYKLSYTGKNLPQPVLAWAQTSQEVRIAFDQPLDLELVKNTVAKVAIEYGRFVSAGDRFERLRPGYQAVQDQLASPRFDLPVLSVQLSRDRRTLILNTARHTGAMHYAVTLPGLGRPAKTSPGELQQLSETDLSYDLSGVEAVWHGQDGSTWSGWLPHLDLQAARAFTRGSADHNALWRLVAKPGKLTLRTRLNAWHMLRPQVQPGSTIDYEWPVEEITLRFRSRSALHVEAPCKSVSDRDGVVVQFRSQVDDIPLEITLESSGDLDLTSTYRTNEDSRPRALPLGRLLMPWVSRKASAAAPRIVRERPELKGGNWLRGRRVFFDSAVGCSACHSIRSVGGRFAPDLSNLPERDYASVFRDITEPNFAINPDFITSVLELKDGRILTGTVRAEGPMLHVGDSNGKSISVHRDLVERAHTAPLSIMPEGYAKLLGPQRLRDLLTFLLVPPPRMPVYGQGPPPPPRTWEEVHAVMAGAAKMPDKLRPLHVVLVGGVKDHGPGEHDYPAWQKAWQQLFSMAYNVKVTTAWEWPMADDLRSADVVVFYHHGQWSADRARDIDAFLQRGGGLVYLHFAVDGGADPSGFAKRIGLAWRGGVSCFRHGPLDVSFARGSRHPIARNFSKVHFHDESYWKLTGDRSQIHILGEGPENGALQPLFWTRDAGQGRVFVSIPGHFAWTFDDPLFRLLILRGTAWAARENVDRFNELALPGARITGKR